MIESKPGSDDEQVAILADRYGKKARPYHTSASSPSRF